MDSARRIIFLGIALWYIDDRCLTFNLVSPSYHVEQQFQNVRTGHSQRALNCKPVQEFQKTLSVGVQHEEPV